MKFNEFLSQPLCDDDFTADPQPAQARQCWHHEYTDCLTARHTDESDTTGLCLTVGCCPLVRTSGWSRNLTYSTSHTLLSVHARKEMNSYNFDAPGVLHKCT
jgi:hypothetical protein